MFSLRRIVPLCSQEVKWPIWEETRDCHAIFQQLSLSLLVFKVVLLILFLTIATTTTIIMLLLRYAVKYNEQLILTLEEDEFSCKQRLAYKLEQVHNIMQGDAQ